LLFFGNSIYVLAAPPISKETLDHYIYEDIITHFLWEITYNGFTEKEMEKQEKRFFGRIKDIKMIKTKKQRKQKNKQKYKK